MMILQLKEIISPNLGGLIIQRQMAVQRVSNNDVLGDFEICNRYDIDNMGLVCPWPSEEVLAYYCLSHAEMFRSKTVIELGSGYGLAGLVVAMATEASEVVISDGNPQVVDYIQHNINANSGAFGPSKVKSLMLHWNKEEVELPSVSGFALLTLVAEHEVCKNIPVIMMSAHDSVNTVYECMLKGAVDFLVKPVRKNELKNLWQHVWRRQAIEGVKFVFEPRTITRMEFLELGDWKLRSITSFAFLDLFAYKVDSRGTFTGFLTSRATNIILSLSAMLNHGVKEFKRQEFVYDFMEFV